MLIHKERLTGSTSSGTLALTTARFSGVRCVQIFCKPATAATTYDIKLTDKDDAVFEELGVEGTLNREVRLPLAGTYTVTISNASSDEAFVFFLGLEEND
jgi:hypothetical protein